MTQMVKNLLAMWETWVRYLGREDPLQYYCLENSMDRGAWRVTVHGVTKSQTTEATKLELLTSVGMAGSLCFSHLRRPLSLA